MVSYILKSVPLTVTTKRNKQISKEKLTKLYNSEFY